LRGSIGFEGGGFAGKQTSALPLGDHEGPPSRSTPPSPHGGGILPGKLDHFAEFEKVFEHHGRVLRIGGKEINGIPFSPLVCFDTVRIDKLLFQSRLMQPEVEQILGEFAVVLQSIGAFTVAKSLIEALGVISQLVTLEALVEGILLALFTEMDLQKANMGFR
jgi:hypothetical protein